MNLNDFSSIDQGPRIWRVNDNLSHVFSLFKERNSLSLDACAEGFYLNLVLNLKHFNMDRMLR